MEKGGNIKIKETSSDIWAHDSILSISGKVIHVKWVQIPSVLT